MLPFVPVRSLWGDKYTPQGEGQVWQ